MLSAAALLLGMSPGAAVMTGAILVISGPTVVGLFAPARLADLRSVPGGGLALTELAASGLAGRVPAPICATPVDAAFGRAITLDAGAPHAV